MCDVCKSEGVDWKKFSGERYALEQHWLYGIYKGRVAPIKLCRLHSIELFLIGENRFLRNHMGMSRELVDRTYGLRLA